MVPHLVEGVPLASKGDLLTAVILAQRSLDRGQRVRLGGAGRDVRSSEPLVGGQALEQSNGLFEVVYCFLGRLVI